MRATALAGKRERRFLYTLCLTGPARIHYRFKKEFFPTLEEKGLVTIDKLSGYIIEVSATLKGFAAIQKSLT